MSTNILGDYTSYMNKDLLMQCPGIMDLVDDLIVLRTHFNDKVSLRSTR